MVLVCELCSEKKRLLSAGTLAFSERLVANCRLIRIKTGRGKGKNIAKSCGQARETAHAFKLVTWPPLITSPPVIPDLGTHNQENYEKPSVSCACAVQTNI